MSDSDGCIWGFVQLSRAWYAEANMRDRSLHDEIMLGHYADEGGVCGLGEFGIRWHVFQSGGDKTPAPQLGMFDEAWGWFAACPELFEWLKENAGKNVTPEQVCTKLGELGFQDRTPEGESIHERPVGRAVPQARRDR